MPPFEDMRCLVLGAGGFLGTNLCRALQGRVAALRALGRRGAFTPDLEGVEWAGMDFLNPTEVARAVEGRDVVFHLIGATTPAIANADKVADLHQNVGGTLQLLELCRAAGVRRVVFVSSGGTVYGKPEIVPTPEFAPANPITAYGVSKLTIEKYLALYEYCHGLQYRVLRVANPFGPYQLGLRSQGVIAAFMRKALAGEPVEIWGDGSAIRDYLYVDDVVSALEAACTHAGDSRVFNIGSGVGRSLLDLIRTIETVSGLRIETHFKQGRPIDVPTSILDVQLAARELLWSPRIPFEQGMRATWEWISQVGITNSRVERHVQ